MVETMAEAFFRNQNAKKSNAEVERDRDDKKLLGKFENMARDALLSQKGDLTRIQRLREQALPMSSIARLQARDEVGEDTWSKMVAAGILVDGQIDPDLWGERRDYVGMGNWDLEAKEADSSCLSCTKNARTCEYITVSNGGKGCRMCVVLGEQCDAPWSSMEEQEEFAQLTVSLADMRESPSHAVLRKRKRVSEGGSEPHPPNMPLRPRASDGMQGHDIDEERRSKQVSEDESYYGGPRSPAKKKQSRFPPANGKQPEDVDIFTVANESGRPASSPKKRRRSVLGSATDTEGNEEGRSSDDPLAYTTKKRSRHDGGRQIAQPAIRSPSKSPAKKRQYGKVFAKTALDEVISMFTTKEPEMRRKRERNDADWLMSLRRQVLGLSEDDQNTIRRRFEMTWAQMAAIEAYRSMGPSYTRAMDGTRIDKADLRLWDLIPTKVPEAEKCARCGPGECEYVDISRKFYAGIRCRRCILTRMSFCAISYPLGDEALPALVNANILEGHREHDEDIGDSLEKEAMAQAHRGVAATDWPGAARQTGSASVGIQRHGDEHVAKTIAWHRGATAPPGGRLGQSSKTVDHPATLEILALVKDPIAIPDDVEWVTGIRDRVLQLPVVDQETIRQLEPVMWAHMAAVDVWVQHGVTPNSNYRYTLKGHMMNKANLANWDLVGQPRDATDECSVCEPGTCQTVDTTGAHKRSVERCRRCFLLVKGKCRPRNEQVMKEAGSDRAVAKKKAVQKRTSQVAGDKEVTAMSSDMDLKSFDEIVDLLTDPETQLLREANDPTWAAALKNRIVKLPEVGQETIRRDFPATWAGMVALDVWDRLGVPPNIDKCGLKEQCINGVNLARWDLVAKKLPVKEKCAECEDRDCELPIGKNPRSNRCRRCSVMCIRCSNVPPRTPKRDAADSNSIFQRVLHCIEEPPATEHKEQAWLSNIRKLAIQLPIKMQEKIRVNHTDIWVKMVALDIRRAAKSWPKEFADGPSGWKVKGNKFGRTDLTQFDLKATPAEDPCVLCGPGGACEYVNFSGHMYKGQKCRVCLLAQLPCNLPPRIFTSSSTEDSEEELDSGDEEQEGEDDEEDEDVSVHRPITGRQNSQSPFVGSLRQTRRSGVHASISASVGASAKGKKPQRRVASPAPSEPIPSTSSNRATNRFPGNDVEMGNLDFAVSPTLHAPLVGYPDSSWAGRPREMSVELELGAPQPASRLDMLQMEMAVREGEMKEKMRGWQEDVADLRRQLDVEKGNVMALARERDEAEWAREEAQRQRDAFERDRYDIVGERDDAVRDRDDAERQREEAIRERDAAVMRVMALEVGLRGLQATVTGLLGE